MGDDAQLPPIGEKEDSPVFKTKTQHTLTEKMRQAATSPIMSIGTIVANNIVSDNTKLDSLTLEDRVNKRDLVSGSLSVFTSSEEKAIESFVKDLKKDPKNPNNVKAVTFNNERHNSPQSVKDLNSKIRKVLWGDAVKNQFNIGELLTAYSGFVDKSGDEDSPLVYNSDDFIIESVENQKGVEGSVIVQSRAKGTRTFNFNYDVTYLTLIDDEGKSLGTAVPVISSSSIDKYRSDLDNLWATDKQLGIALEAKFANLQYGYAITSHKAQGSTYTNTYVFEDNILGPTNGGDVKTKNKSLYVAVSRPTSKLVMISSKNTNSSQVIETGELKQSTSLDSFELPSKVIDTMRKMNSKQLEIFRKMKSDGIFTTKC